MKKFLRDPAFLAVLIILVTGPLIYSVMADDGKPSKDTPVPITKDASVPKSLELYQQYYDLQRQRDTAGEEYDNRFSAAWHEIQSVKKQLASNSSDIEIHRRLIRAQIEQKQSTTDWLAAIHPIDEKMDTIRTELENRGEPPPE